jgi:UDP-N-acetylglucosamine--N-acetylmuramyl-(pentapeptide) pyrophosphoryl-undecaprenol N-acetylglucosamine transferase
MSASVVIAAGGTGGHLVPGLAVAAALRRLDPETSIAFVGTKRELDRTLIPAAGYTVYATSVAPFARDARALVAGASLVPATWQARSILRKEKASVVVGMGGYPSVPVIAAARLSKVPAVVHEANAIPGLANELAARFTPNVAVSFPATLDLFRGRARYVGMPLRETIAHFDRSELRAEALKIFDLAEDVPTVLVFGGSLGATKLNELAVGLAGRWRDRADRQMLVVAGGANAPALSERMSGNARTRVVPFVTRMELAYAAADIVVCRSGASTVHELAVVGLPAILVPFPAARRLEQHANARMLVDAGAARMIENDHATPERIDPLLTDILSDEETRARMAAAARNVARPDAADVMAEWIMELSKDGRG